MFNFFFALFGGLYYGGRYAIEKGNRNAFEASMNKDRLLYYHQRTSTRQNTTHFYLKFNIDISILQCYTVC